MPNKKRFSVEQIISHLRVHSYLHFIIQKFCFIAISQ